MRLLPKKGLAVIALLALGSAACVEQDDPGVGLVKFDSSAVFGIAPKVEEVVPSFTVPDDVFEVDLSTPIKRIVPDPKVDGPCPEAALTAFPKKSASVRVSDMPTPGLYKWKRNVLAIKNTVANPDAAIRNLDFALEGRAIRRVTREGDHQFSFEMLAPDPFTSGNTVITGFRVNTNDELLVDRNVPARTIGVVDIPGTDVRLANPADQPGIFITKIETQNENAARVSAFEPVQPMLIAPLEGGILRSGQTFQSIGIDATTGSAITNDGITGRASRVDACGEIVEGYTITLHQTLTTDLQDGESPITNIADLATSQETREITYTFATQYGALPIGESLSIGDIAVTPIAAIGKWELGALVPTALPDSLK